MQAAMKTEDPEYDQFLNGVRERIKKLRLERGWTLEETEEHGSISWRHLQRIESGANFTMYTLFRICKLFKVKASDLFNHKK